MCCWAGCRSSTTGARTWSAIPAKVWIGLEYFCYDTDDLWKMPDEEMKKFAIAEVAKIGILNAADVSDAHVVRVPKTYPAYFGTYDRFDELKTFTDRIENLFLVGRNGMHKYNNQDHSMLTAMHVVDRHRGRQGGQAGAVGDQHRAGIPRGEGQEVRRLPVAG